MNAIADSRPQNCEYVGEVEVLLLSRRRLHTRLSRCNKSHRTPSSTKDHGKYFYNQGVTTYLAQAASPKGGPFFPLGEHLIKLGMLSKSTKAIAIKPRGYLKSQPFAPCSVYVMLPRGYYQATKGKKKSVQIIIAPKIASLTLYFYHQHPRFASSIMQTYPNLNP